DWSSDVCSSDLGVGLVSHRVTLPHAPADRDRQVSCEVPVDHLDAERLIGHDDRAAEIAVCIRPRHHLAVTYRRHRRKMLFRQVIRPVIAAAVCVAIVTADRVMPLPPYAASVLRRVRCHTEPLPLQIFYWIQTDPSRKLWSI